MARWGLRPSLAFRGEVYKRMDDIIKRKFVQRMKKLDTEKFMDAQNEIHTKVYEYGIEHVFDAMSCHPRISKKMIEEVKAKHLEIRELWHACFEVYTVESTLEKIIEEVLEKKYGITKEKAI